jgi:DNA primase
LAEATDEIRARIDIVELVGQRVALKRAAKDWKGLCPFHDDKNPSFQVSPTTGRYRCWSCGESGDVFTWVMKTQNVEFVEALQILAAQAGVALPRNARSVEPSKRSEQAEAMSEALAFFRNQLARETVAKDYCHKRGIEDDAIELWEIGYAPDEGSALATHLRKKNHSLAECRSLFLVDQDSGGGYFDRFRGRLMFPIRDERGELVAFGGRILGDGHPKYVNSGDTPLFKKSRTLYGMFRAKDKILKDRKAILVEGYLDVIACHKAGLTHAVASLGTALTEDHAKMLKRWGDGVIVLYDSDSAGQKAAERAIEVLEPEGLKVRIVLLPQGEDPDTMIRRDGPGSLQRAVAAHLTPTEYRLELLKKRMGPDQEEFWAEAVRVIAGAPSDRDMEMYIMRMAPLHPQLRDTSAAISGIRADVLAIRKGRDRKDGGYRPKVAVMRSALLLSAAERVLFQAFIASEHRLLVHSMLGEEDIFETNQAAALAEELLRAFPQAPSGSPSEWLHLMEPSSAQILIDLDLESRADPITKPFIDETIGSLRRKRERRQLRQLKTQELDDAGKRDYLDRLRKLKDDSAS